MDEEERNMRCYARARSIVKRINSGKLMDFCAITIAGWLIMRETEPDTPEEHDGLYNAFKQVGINLKRYIKDNGKSEH